MASTSKGSSAVRTENMFCPAGGVCKHGFLIKSPPLQLFSSQNSWKRRFFILTKSSNGNYILKYLKGQNIKGSIAVDQITNIKVGISNSEIMEMVRKMFKCLPEQVMSIITGNRCYYLIGSSRQETEDWVTVISSVCREAKRGGCCPQDKSLGRSEENLLSSDTDEDIKKDEEEYYQTPRSILAKCTTEVSKPDHTAKSDVPVQEKPVQNLVNENIYMPMKSLRLLDESCQLTCRCDGLLSPPKQQDNDVCPRDLEANRDLTLPESSTSQQQAFQRRQSSLPLSVVQLSVLLSQVTDETQLQKLDIFIPLVDIESYLKLTEAAGQICVSQWAGPCRLGCLFNHGDHIMAVNDLKPQNVEEAYFFISRSTRKEVKLTVCRIPHSDTFHVIGCSCS
ncbi:pleckstrin homology domain-containing family S member 1 isoform X3 [Phalacrocorax aristotelis]|uniref:pleckstrin homology domain-containing family S member 1 isoform X3 n=1 Tax=Phalacrocorax aristotelis TaxID=126867 RepID=UPI003F4B8D87